MPKQDVQACPMCGSTFDGTKYKLLECSICSGEGSTACCIGNIINGGDPVCNECEDVS